MTLGPGDVVAGRYEPIRLLGGDGEAGRVYLAFDRQLGREVALRLVERGDGLAAAALLEEGRRMSAVHAHSPAAIAVLDAGEIEGGGAYTATELVEGVPLEELARRAPIPLADALAHAVELLDACIAVRRHAQGGPDIVVASALRTPEGRIRVTRFARAAGPGPAGAEPASAATAETLLDLLAGAELPPELSRTVDDALAGRIRTAAELRGRLLERDTPTAVLPPPPPPEPSAPRWPWVVGAIALLLALAVAAGLLLAGDDADRVRVPDATGQPAAAAVAALRSAGFEPRAAGRVDPAVAPGLVIGTSPPAGEEAEAGSEVVVAVSQGAGEAVVPALTGLTRAAADAELRTAGLAARFVEQESGSAAEGVVLAQDPAAGLRIPPGSTVAVTISAGVAPVVVPDLSGRTADQAAVALGQAGLAAGSVTQEARDDVPDGTIVAQVPAPSARVPPGTEVDVIVAVTPPTTG